MSAHDALELIVASLYDATIDDADWPVTSAPINQACGPTASGRRSGFAAAGREVGADLWMLKDDGAPLPADAAPAATFRHRPVRVRSLDWRW